MSCFAYQCLEYKLLVVYCTFQRCLLFKSQTLGCKVAKHKEA